MGQKFDAFAKRYGGKYETNDKGFRLDESELQLIASNRGKRLNRGPREIEFGHVMAEGFGARSYVLNEIGIIAFNAFNGQYFRNRARALLSYPDVFPFIGNPKLCQDPIDFPKLVHFEMQCGQTVPEIGCPNRDAFASQLAQMCMVFTLDHEFAHLANGHVLYLLEKSNSISFSELGCEREQASEKLRPIIQQTLEWDADLMAAQRLLSTLLGAKEASIPERESKVWIPHYPRIFPNIGDIVLTAVAVIGLWCGVYDLLNGKAGEKNSHPPSFVRFKYLTSYISYLLNDMCCVDENAADRSVERGILGDQSPGCIGILPAWMRFKGINIQDVDFSFLMHAHLEEEKQYPKIWSEIWPDLHRLAWRSNIAPPSKIN